MALGGSPIEIDVEIGGLTSIARSASNPSCLFSTYSGIVIVIYLTFVVIFIHANPYTTPHLTHRTTNSTVFLLPVFRNKFRRCVSTVCTLRPRLTAACLLDRPSAKHLISSNSFLEK